MGATSRLDEIDDAFLRPGRFDQVVLVDLPSLQDRFDIVRGVFGSMLPIEKCEVVAKGSNGWTCADICAFKRHLYFNSICVGTEARSLDLAANLVAFGK